MTAADPARVASVNLHGVHEGSIDSGGDDVAGMLFLRIGPVWLFVGHNEDGDGEWRHEAAALHRLASEATKLAEQLTARLTSSGANCTAPAEAGGVNAAPCAKDGHDDPADNGPSRTCAPGRPSAVTS